MSSHTDDNSDPEEPFKKSKLHFSTFEKSSLLELVGKNKTVIEWKETDFGTTDKKSKVRNAIAEEFNSDSNVSSRDAKQLKNKWENLKHRAKKHLCKPIYNIIDLYEALLYDYQLMAILFNYF
jgi:hypothetical protein